MGMSRQQAIESLRPIFVLQYFAENEVNAYVDVIVETCGWMNGLHFNEVVKELMKEIKTNVRLKPAHFIGKYKELAETRHWATEPKKVCSSCVMGSGLVYTWVRRKGTANEYRAMKRCPECQGDSKLKDGLEEISAPETPTEFDWKKIKPGAARWMFSLIEESPEWHFPAEYIQRLAEIAGQDEALTAKEPVLDPIEVTDEPPEF